MRITYLELINFKNISSNFKFAPDNNLIIAPNGAGKTNILESIYYLSRAKSFRHANERNLLGWDTKSNFLKVTASIEKDHDQTSKFAYILADEAGILRKKFVIDGVKYQRMNYSYQLPTILFLPEHVNLIGGPPDGRREEIDDFLSLTLKDFKVYNNDYAKILKNRNILLKMIKQGKANSNELNYWDEGIIKTGSKIIWARTCLLKDILPYVRELAEDIFHKDLSMLEFRYISKLVSSKNDKEEQIREMFEKKIYAGRDNEIGAGITLYGPQRDDIEFVVGKVNLNEFGSRGQQRLVAVIFKLAMWFFYFKSFNEKPILLLDDVMSEVDEAHKKSLERALLKLDTQIIFTSTSNEDFSKKLLKTAKFIEI